MARVALIGDSQSEALWPRVMKLMPHHEFVLVRTERGWAENRYRKEGKLEQQLKDAKPELVVVELGGNNSSTTESKYLPNVEWLLNAARQSGARRILWLGPAAATKEPYKAYKEWTRATQSKVIASQPDVVWVDSFPHTQTGHVDGVHFGASVYTPWSAAIAKYIDDALAKRTALTGPLSSVPWYVPTAIGILVVGIAVGYVAKRKRRRRR